MYVCRSIENLTNMAKETTTIKKLLKNGKVLTVRNNELEKSKKTVKKHEELKKFEAECLHDNTIVLYWYSTYFGSNPLPQKFRKKG